MINRRNLKQTLLGKPIAALTLIVIASLSQAQVGTAGLQIGGGHPAGETANSLSPIQTVSGNASDASQVYLRQDGSIVAEGTSAALRLPLGLAGVQQVRTGGGTIVAILKDGALAGWGNNTYGQLSFPANTKAISVAVSDYNVYAVTPSGKVLAFGSEADSALNVPPTLTKVVKVEAGPSRGVALKSDGTVAAWGYNGHNESTVPANLSGVVQIACGSYHTLALKKDGKVIAWGYNPNGECSVPSTLSDVVQVAASLQFSVALKSNGKVVGWGLFPSTSTPISNISQISATNSSILALRTDGTFIQWNSNSTKTGLKAGKSILDVASGFSHTLVLNGTGRVQANGDNSYGQALVPAGLYNVVQIAAGPFHSLALNSDGTVVAWGYDGYGQATVPKGLKSVVQIVAGASHSVALQADGSVVAWGFADAIKIPSGVRGVTYIATNLNMSCTLGLKSDGTVVGWGNDGGSGVIDKLPKNLKTIVQIGMGNGYAVALQANGDVVGWGSVPGATVPGLLDTVTRLVVGDSNVIGYHPNLTFDVWPGGLSNYNLEGAVKIAGDSVVSAVAIVAETPAIFQGGTSIATLSLPIAPTTDVDIPITTSDVRVQVPALVKVKAGTRFATFNITSIGTYEDVATITAKYLGATAVTTLNVKSKVAGLLGLSPNTLKGGTPFTGTVRLTNGVASAAGIEVKLASSQTSVVVPASVTIPAGSSSATFSGTTRAVSSDTVANITTSIDQAVRTASMIVKAPVLTTLTLDPKSVRAGSVSKGTVTLDGVAAAAGFTIALTSSSKAATVPDSVTVPAGATLAAFDITTSSVSASTDATITAKYFASSKTGILTVAPSAAQVNGLTLAPSVVKGDENTTATVTLDIPAPTGGSVVTLTSDNPAASVPASVTVPEGKTSATFSVDTLPVSANRAVSIRATLGTSNRTATLTVSAPLLAIVALSSNRIKGGTSATGHVVLDGPAPAGGLSVTITTSGPTANAPATVTVLEGSYLATFAISTKAVSASTRVTITAKIGTTIKQVTLTVTP